MKKLLAVGLILALPCAALGFFFSPGGSGGGSATTSASDLTSGTLPAARIADNSVKIPKLYTTGGTASATTYFRGDNTWATPTGTGTVTEVTGDTMVGVATGTTTPALSLTDNSITGAKLIANVTFNTTGYLSFGADPAESGALRLSNNTAVAWEQSTPGTDIFLALDSSDIFQVGQNAVNITLGGPTKVTTAVTPTAAGAGTIGTAALEWGNAYFNDGAVIYGQADQSAALTSSAGYWTAATPSAADNSTKIATTLYVDRADDLKAAVNRTKTFSFGWDNAAATDNVLMWRPNVAVTITRWDCSASTDNVIGNLMECATDNVTNCGVVDAVSVGGVTATVAPSSDTTLTDGAIAAGAWLRWSTTSVGSALNRFTCTLQYNE